jgi:hypothetical protein
MMLADDLLAGIADDIEKTGIGLEDLTIQIELDNRLLSTNSGRLPGGIAAGALKNTECHGRYPLRKALL